MRLVIEREGGFDVIEDHETITKIDVQNFGVKVKFMAEEGGEWSEVYPVADHAAACRLSAAIAVKCGALVEGLAPAPQESAPEMVGASEWVAGEPPRDGRWYVCDGGDGPMCIGWAAGGGWVDWTGRGLALGPEVFYQPGFVPPR